MEIGRYVTKLFLLVLLFAAAHAVRIDEVLPVKTYDDITESTGGWLRRPGSAALWFFHFDMKEPGYIDESSFVPIYGERGAIFVRSAEEFDRLKRVFSGEYKFHLMPKPRDLAEVANLLAHEVNSNKDFRQALAGFKVVRGDFETDASVLRNRRGSSGFFDDQQNVLPMMVLYTRNKKDALLVMEQLFKLLDRFVGLQAGDLPYSEVSYFFAKTPHSHGWGDFVVPRYSIAALDRAGRPSSIIYYTQGNGDLKGMKTTAEPDVFSFKLRANLTQYNEKNFFNGPYVKDVLYDATKNFALLRPNFLGEITDFTLHLPDRTAA